MAPPERLQRHTAKVEEIKKRMDLLHNRVSILEEINPLYGLRIIEPGEHGSSSKRLRVWTEYLNGVYTANLKNYTEIVNELETGKGGYDKDFLRQKLDKNDEKMKNNYTNLEEEISGMEEKLQGLLSAKESLETDAERLKEKERVEKLHEALRKNLGSRVENATTLADEQLHKKIFEVFLLPNDRKDIIAKAGEVVRGQFIQRLKEVRNLQEKVAIGTEISHRFGPDAVRGIIQEAETDLAADRDLKERQKKEIEEADKQEMYDRHQVLVDELDQKLKPGELEKLYEIKDDNGMIIKAGYVRPKLKEGYVISDGVRHQMTQEDVEKEEARHQPPKEEPKAVPRKVVPRRRTQRRVVKAPALKPISEEEEYAKILKAALAAEPDELELAELDFSKPLPPLPPKSQNHTIRTLDLANILPSGFVAKVHLENPGDVHRVYDSIYAIWHDHEAAGGFLTRFNEKPIKEIIEISRAMNHLAENREWMDTYLKHAKEADWKGAKRISQAINRLSENKEALTAFMERISKMDLDGAILETEIALHN